MLSTPRLVSLLPALLLSLAGPLSAEGVTGIAQLSVPEGAAEVLKAVESLPVRALPVVPGEPVAKNSVLAEMNLEKLERELRELQKELRSIQEEKRYRGSNKEVQRGGGSSSSLGPDNSLEANLAIKEANAMRDLLQVQTKLSIASPRAPEDGYLVRTFYSVGADAKRRKPLVSFVAAEKTLLTVTLPDGAASDFPSGTEVTVLSPEDSSRRFRGVIASSAASAAGLELTIRPLELPFLALDRSSPVTVSKTP